MSFTKTKVFVLCLLVASSLMGQKIVVMDLRSDSDISSRNLNSLSGRLRGAVVDTRKFTVMERNEIGAIDEELTLQYSDAFDEKKVAEAGKKIGAEYVVLSYIGQGDDIYNIEVKWVNTTTAQIDKSFTEEMKGYKHDRMLRLMEKIANQMAGIEEEKSKLWMYLTGGGVVTIATIAILLSGEEAEPTGLPEPPAPPSN